MTAHRNLQHLWPGLNETFSLVLIGQPQEAAIAQDMGIDASPIGKFVDADVNETATNKAYEFSSRLYNDPLYYWMSSKINNSSGYVTPGRLKQWWPAMVGEHIRQQTTMIETLKKVFAEFKPSGCIVHEDVTPDMRALVMFCKARGVPTIHVPHATCFYTGEEWDIHTESISDWIAASGTYSADFYNRWGFPAERITMTGAPQLDSWYIPNPLSRAEARLVLGVKLDDFLMIYATSWGQLTSSRGGFDDEHQRNFDMICNAALELKATLCIKMHPGEAPNQEQMYNEQLHKRGINGFITRAYNEYVLRAGDVMVAHGPSNIGVSSAIIGLPTAYIPTEGFGFPPGPIAVSDSVVEAVAEARTKTKDYWDDFAKQMNEPHNDFENGSACERIVKFVKEVCL